MARGHLKTGSPLETGKENGVFVATIPMAVDADLLVRGRDATSKPSARPATADTGRGDGMIVQRGFKKPSSYHIDRLREAPPGYLFDVITNGFGAMSDYSAQTTPEERWAIVAYVRALQLSQNATVAELPEDVQSEASEERTMNTLRASRSSVPSGSSVRRPSPWVPWRGLGFVAGFVLEPDPGLPLVPARASSSGAVWPWAARPS